MPHRCEKERRLTLPCLLALRVACWQVEAILDMLAHCTCVDHLSRLLVDVHQDSSQIMNDLLSPYQRALLQMVFNGDMMARNK